MANDVESTPDSGEKFFGGVAPDLYLQAQDALRFVLDGSGAFACSDTEFEDFYGKAIVRGDRFESDRVLPSSPVQAAIDSALSGQTLERRLVLFPKATDRDSVWIFEAIPFDAPELAEGKGIAGVFLRVDMPAGRRSLDEMLFSVTLAERLALERLGTAKAVVATIRHEISNALTTIIGNAELMLRKSAAEDKATRDRILDIVGQGHRIQQVIEKLDSLTDVRTTRHYGGYELLELDLELTTELDPDPDS